MRSLDLIAACCLFAAAAPFAAADEPAAGKAPIARFYRVDAHLYRGAQPDAAGFRYLRDIGVKTVINLRSEADAVQTAERRIVESLGMRYVQLPVEDGSFFRRSRRIPADTIREFFAVLDAAGTEPVFVHCRRGADRTGALVGFYRIVRHGWDGARAYAEARRVGMRSWYTGLRRQIEEFGREGTREAERRQPDVNY